MVIPGSESGERRSVGLLTIGQAGRQDGLATDVAQILGEGVRVVVRGALDGLTREQVKALGPRRGGHVLVSQLADASSVQLDHDAILNRLQDQITNLEAEGALATLILCTGEFPPLRHDRPLLLPSAALRGAVVGMAGGRRVASLVPLPDQAAQSLAWWAGYGAHDPLIAAADPYAPDALEAVERAAAEVAAAPGPPPEVLFLDCFGYTQAMRDHARRRFRGPIVLARSLAARLLAEIAA